MARNIGIVEIENAELIFRNFSGKEGKYNREGDRSFCVFIDDANMAQEMAEDGWNIRVLRPRDDQEDPRHYVSVAINFNFWKKPEVYLISGRSKTLLDEESIGVLDGADITNVDLVIRPRQWDDDGRPRIKAYLQEMYVTIEQSRFAAKYAEDNNDDLPF